MNCGIAEAATTPPVGGWLHGFGARDRVSEGVSDELLLQCAVFEEEGSFLAIVRADVLAFGPDSVERIRGAVQEETGIPGGNVMLAASHTHSGPAVSAVRGMGDVDESYLWELENAALGAVTSALKEMEPARVGVGKGEAQGLAFVREGPGKGEASPDPSVTVLKVARERTGEPLALLVNYACHPVVFGSANYLISADYPGAAREFVRRALGVPALFLQGACGDLNPLCGDLGGPSGGPDLSLEQAGRIGRTIGEKAVKLAELARAGRATELASTSSTARLPTVRPGRGELQGMIDHAEQCTNRKLGGVTRRWAADMLHMLDAGSFPDFVECPVQVLRIGEALLVGVAAEVFSEIGLAVKHALGPDRTLFVGYANGCIGYVPSTESYDTADYGARGAALWYGLPALAKGSDTILAETIKRQVRDRVVDGKSASSSTERRPETEQT